MNNPTPIRARCKRTQGQRIRRGERRQLKRQFLLAYAQEPNVSSTCTQVGISRAGLYQWLARDEQFKAKYQALAAAYYDIWIWSSDDEWEAHLELRRQGLRLIRYYLQRDIEITGIRTMRDVKREQKQLRLVG